MSCVWTDEQRKRLVECAFHMTQITEHDFTECTYELRSLKKRIERGEVNDDGTAKPRRRK